MTSFVLISCVSSWRLVLGPSFTISPKSRRKETPREPYLFDFPCPCDVLSVTMEQDNTARPNYLVVKNGVIVDGGIR